MKRQTYIPLLALLLLLAGGFVLLRKWQTGTERQPAESAEVGMLTPSQNGESAMPEPPADTTTAISQQQPPTAPAAATGVLKNLYAVYGNRQRPCPTLVFTDDDQGPRYRESANAIVLDGRSMQVCRSFGRDSLSALAFIIGHELAHFFQEETGGGKAEFSYLAYDKKGGSDSEKERLADVQGIFNAYLAGYRSAAILPKLIAKLYESYELKSKLDGYPALAKRQATSAEVLATVDTLAQLYETANYLTALGQYELAAASYRYILQYYPGREVYANLGTCHALHALFCSKKSPDSLLYPLEIDVDSRLKRQQARGGESELSDDERALRKQLLLEAEKALKTAGRLDPTYFPVDVNLLCVLALQGRFAEAKKHWNDHRIMQQKRLSAGEKSRARLALGLVLAQTGVPSEKAQAERIFQEIAGQKSDPALASMAAHNLKALQGNLPKQPATAFDCVKPFELNKVDGVSIHRIGTGALTDLPGPTQLSFFLKKLPTSTILQFCKSGQPVLNFQRVQDKRKAAAPSFVGKRPQTVTTPTGFFLVCGEEHAVFLFGNQNRLAEWGRFYRFEAN